MMRLSKFAPLSVVAAGYVNLVRSLPLVLVIFWFFFLIPWVWQWVTGAERPVPVGAFLSALITFTMFEAAYYAEIMRAGIQSVRKGQVGAGYALGMTYWPGHGLRRSAAGLPQHAAGAADPDHHPVPGHLARLRAVDHRLPRRGEQDRQSRFSTRRDVSLRRRSCISRSPSRFPSLVRRLQARTAIVR